MKKLLFLVLFTPLVSLYSQEIEAESQRFKLLSKSILLDRMSGKIYTNNFFNAITPNEWANNRIYVNKVRYECKKTWCLLAEIENSEAYTQLFFDAIEDDMYGFVLVNTLTGEQYVSNFLSYTYNDDEVQEVLKNKGGINGIPRFLSAMINCPEGRWCSP